MEKKSASASVQISFRLTPGIAEELSAQAESAGMSSGEYARKLVIDSLAAAIEGSDRPLTRADLDETFDSLHDLLAGHLGGPTQDGEQTTLLGQLKRLREDLATVAFALLVGVGNQDHEETKDWVQKNLMIETPK